MSECWRVDAAAELRSYLLSELGPDSAYETLQVQQVLAVRLRDITEWETYSIDELLPMVIIQGRQWAGEAAQHGGDPWIIGDKRHIYTIAALVEGTIANATRDAEILGRRIERALLTKKTINAESDDGERGHQISMTSGEILTFKKRDSVTDSWFGVCLLGMRIDGSG